MYVWWQNLRARTSQSIPTWTRFELYVSWISSAVGNRCDRPTPFSFFIQKLKSRTGRVNQHWKGSAAQYISTKLVLATSLALGFFLTLISIEKVLQIRNISTKLVLALGATYQVGKPQLIKKKSILRFRERHALDEEETGQDLSHRYYWTRFELEGQILPCLFFIQSISFSEWKYALFLSVVVCQPGRWLTWLPTLALVLCWYYWAAEPFPCWLHAIWLKFCWDYSFFW